MKWGIEYYNLKVEEEILNLPSGLLARYFGYPLKPGHTTHTGNAEPQLGNVECADIRQAGAWRSQLST